MVKVLFETEHRKQNGFSKLSIGYCCSTMKHIISHITCDFASLSFLLLFFYIVLAQFPKTGWLNVLNSRLV